MSNHTNEEQENTRNNNLLIFSLLNHKYCPNKVYQLFNDLNDEINAYNKIYEVFDEKAVKIVKQSKINDVPTNILMLTNLTNLIVEKIAQEYPNLTDLVENLEDFSKSMQYLPQTKNQVINFLRDTLNIPKVSDVEQNLNSKIYSIIESYQPISTRSILIKIRNEQSSLTEEKLNHVLEGLAKSKRIQLKASGYYIRYMTLPSILETLNHDEYDFIYKLLNRRLVGKKINKRDINRFRQYILDFPVLFNESLYKSILDQYNVSLRLLREYKQNDLMIGYVLLKYDFKPKFTTEHFIKDEKLWQTYAGQEAIKKASLAYINDSLVSRTQVEVLKSYVRVNNTLRFHSKQVKEFKEFIESNRLEDIFVLNDYESFYKELANIESLTLIDDYLYYVDLELDKNFYIMINNYLANLSHIESCKVLYLQATEKIDKSKIKNYRELYAIIKTRFKWNFRGKIKFSDNWFTMAPNNYDINQYAYDLLLKNNCIKKHVFVSQLAAATMIHKSSIEEMIATFINKYTIGNHLEIPTSSTFTESEKTEYKDIIGEYFIDKLILFKKVKSEINELTANRLINSAHLELLGYNTDTTAIFNNVFTDFNDAFVAWLQSKGKRIDESEIEKRLKINSSRFYKFIRSLHLVKVSDFTYYNTAKFFDLESLKKIRDDVLSLFEDGEIFGFDEIIKHPKYHSEIRNAYPNVDFDFLEATFLQELIRNSPNVYYYKGNGVAFRKGKRLLKSDIVHAEVLKAEKLNIIDLQAIIVRKYKIRNFNESFINEAKKNYNIYKDSQGNLYKNKKTHDKLMEGYLKYGRTKRS